MATSKAILFLDRLFAKVTSARFIVTLGLTYTFCLISYQTIMLFFENLENEKVSGSVEKMAMFIMGAFCTQFANVVTSYFGRNDRTQIAEETTTTETEGTTK
jgi:hypothetical protein